MLLILILIIVEVLVFLVLRDLFFRTSRMKFIVSVTLNFAISIWIWFVLIKILLFRGSFDTPENVNNRMNLAGLIAGAVAPRILIIIFHFLGRLVRFRKKGYSKFMTWTALWFSAVISIIVGLGSFVGRYNFKTEEVTVNIRNLPAQLDGLKIIQLSDMHLASFYRHHERLEKIMERVNSYKPDMIINTGDFISYGWREFDSCDTILKKAVSRYGNYAVFGNHDMGTYFPNTNPAEMESNILKMTEKIKSSGYRLLTDENISLDIKGIKTELIGVHTSGRFPGMIHGDLKKALAQSDTSVFKILIAHDPNQWDKDVAGKTDINLTLSGHTHGMQMGIITKRFRWSPSKHFYPHWGGLYSKGDQFLYVNRGLGVLAVPFRIWMPPEITIISLKIK